ncbi:hypothetical protein BDW22DRAFT_1353869 [Trametopsis cervina]|nr:hypothetical protein BDW22DRAFT_1353869 [Trametopsis cervina]
MRLVRAFGLTNTFVSSSEDVHAQFTLRARNLISAATPKGGWQSFEDATVEVVNSLLPASPNERIPFDSFVQHVTLKIILHTLFEVPMDSLDDVGIALISHGINQLWRLSKTPEELPPHLLPAINAHLHAWIPDIPNPLDFVVPTFETLWRVVAITVALGHKDESAVRALQALLENPTKSQFQHFAQEDPSVSAIVAEVMRLYPATKSISRASQEAPPTLLSRAIRSIIPLRRDPVVLVADIRSVQRDPEIWGTNADEFDPMRHRTLTGDQQRALLGFGLGKLQCVASSWAPVAVGLIAAAVINRLRDGVEIVEGEGVGDRDGWDGWAVITSPLA